MKEFLARAKTFLDVQGEENLIYACLELRLAIECHVYKKLEYYSKKHGSKLLFKEWQPDRAIKILCQFEPFSDQSYTVSFAKESGPVNSKTDFKVLGKHEALTARWIRKNYQKLGSFLHLQPETVKSKKLTKENLQPIYKELYRVLGSDLISDLSETIQGECALCESNISGCVNALPNLKTVYCPNPSCNATYSPIVKEGEWVFRIDTTDFVCPDCSNEQRVLESELKVGTRITCKACNSRFGITQVGWGLEKLET